jgi:ParB family chromosome partitioning protein
MAKISKSAARPRLGRGLSSLVNSSLHRPDDGQDDVIPADAAAKASKTRETAPEAAPDGKPLDVPIGQIQPNPYQPRRQFEPEQLVELAASIAEQGILQPLVVCRAAEGEGSYVLVAGERRLRAARQAGLATVPCVVRQATRQQMLEWALIENIQRADLNAVERAVAYRDYLDRFGVTQEQAAQKLGVARATVANFLRILDLPDEVQEMLVSGRLTAGHAKAVASLAGPDKQLALAKRIAADGLSVRQAEQLAVAMRVPTSSPEPAKTERVARPAYLSDLEDQLAQAVGTRVRIQPGRAKNTGRIVIDFYNLDDFDRISGSLGLRVDS